MKNVTITLEDAVAIRADAEAASRRETLSQFVGALIEREVRRREADGLEAMQRFLSGPDLASLGSAGRPATRRDVNDERIDELVRRYERSNLRDR